MNPIAQKIADAMASGAGDVAARSGIKGLTEDDVQAGKTPEAIANIWLRRMLGQKSDKDKLEREEREAAQKQFPLLPYSQLVYDLEQKHPGVYDFPLVLQYDTEKIDTKRLNAAIATAIKNHPVFRTEVSVDGQKLHVGSDPVCSFTAIKAEDGYLRIRLNRILGDGYSFGLLLEDICKAYQGVELEPDYYFRYLQLVENHKQSAEYAEHKEELREHYGAVDDKIIPVHPTLDKEIEEGDEWLAGEYILPLALSEATWGKGAEGGKGASMNESVCMATALAIMDYCGTDEAALTWAYLGRENEQERHIFGSLHKDIPLKVQRAKCSVQSDIMSQVREEMQRGICLSDYPWTLTDPQHAIWQYAVNVLQQPRLEDINLHGLEFWPSEEGTAKNEEGRTGMAYSLLDIEIEDGLLRFKYSATHYKEASIIRFAELIKRYL